MKKNFNQEERKTDFLISLGEIDGELLENAKSYRVKKKSFISSNVMRYASMACAFVLVCSGVFFGFSKLGDIFDTTSPENIPEQNGKNEVIEYNRIPEIEGKVLIESADSWNFYAGLKAIYDSQSRSASLSSPILLSETSGGFHPEDELFPVESGFGVTAERTDKKDPPDEEIYYYNLSDFGEIRITSATYFEIELTDKRGFLASKIGVGKVKVVINYITGLDEKMITFKNGDKYYSCLQNSYYNFGDFFQDEFSTHKYIEGFYVVKNLSDDIFSYKVDMKNKDDVIGFDCSGYTSMSYLADEVKLISGTTLYAEIDEGYTIEELEEFFNNDVFFEEVS